MKKIQISESRLRHIIREELINENIFSNIQSTTGFIRDSELRNLNNALNAAINFVSRRVSRDVSRDSELRGTFDPRIEGQKQARSVYNKLWKSLKTCDTVEMCRLRIGDIVRQLSDASLKSQLTKAMSDSALEKWLEFAKTL